MSEWLRHHPPIELEMSEDGWVSLTALAKRLKVTEEAILAKVARDKKTRYSVRGEFIRAAQGHTTSKVTVEALEASWTLRTFEEVPVIFHGTNHAAWKGIQETGLINSGARTHVHCAIAPDSVVGKRADTPVLIKISTENLTVWESENGVFLVREIPMAAVLGVMSE